MYLKINLYDNVLRKVPGDNGGNLVAVCLTWQNTYVLTHQAFVDAKKNRYLSKMLLEECLGGFSYLVNPASPYNPENSEVTMGQWPSLLIADTPKAQLS